MSDLALSVGTEPLIRSAASVFPKAFVSPGEIALNDTAHLVGPQTITIHNLGSSSKSFAISNKPALAALTFGAVSRARVSPSPLAVRLTEYSPRTM